MKEFLIGLIIGLISGMIIGIVNMCILIVGKDGDIDGWFKKWVNRQYEGMQFAYDLLQMVEKQLAIAINNNKQEIAKLEQLDKNKK